MRFGIPKYRLPREVLDAEVQRICDLGVTIEYNAKVDNISRRHDGRRLRRGLSRRRRAYRQARLHPGRRLPRKILDAVQVLRSMEGEDKPLLGRRVVVYGGGNTALDVARTAKRLGAEEAVIVYRRTREKMPAHDFEVEEALEEGIMMKWLSTIKNVEDGAITVEKMALDEKGFPQPTGEFETLEADSVVLALGQDVDLSLLEGVRGPEVKDGVVQVGREHDDRRPRHFRGRRHGAVGAHRHRRGRPRQEGGAPHRRLAARRDYTPAPKHEIAVRGQAQHLVLRRGAEDRAADAGNRAAHVDLRRGREGPRRNQRAVRGAALPVLRQLLRMRQLLRRLPG